MSDLVAFLRARLDEDAARAAQWHDLECDVHAQNMGGIMAALATSQMLAEVPGAVCDCGGPARVLADVAARRDWLSEHIGVHRCDWGEHRGGLDLDPCTTLQRLAAPYQGHQDFDSDWLDFRHSWRA